MTSVLPLLLMIAAAEVPLAYLPSPPVADGRLAPQEAALEARPFPLQLRFDNPDVEVPEIAYRLGYDERHLYVAISTSADAVTYRNRGYLWGDGYRIVLTDPRLGPSSGTHVDLIVSPRPEGDPRAELAMAAQDGVQVYRKLSPASRVAEAAGPDGTLFEAAIAWEDIAPFDPAFMPAMGLNLYFAKGFEDAGGAPFSYGHALVGDEGIFDEEVVHRRGVPVRFGAAPAAALATGWRPAARALAQGQPLMIDRAGRGGDPALSMTDATGLEVARASGGRIDTRGIAPGRYRLAEEKGRGFDVLVLPPVDTQAIADSAATRLGEGAIDVAAHDSIRFLVGDYQQRLDRMAPYAAPEGLLGDARRLAAIAQALEDGMDPFAPSGEPIRRGYRSQLDGSFQPYGLRLPEGYEPSGSYPALVFLHGSGSDDRGLLDARRGDGRFIEIAPRGRVTTLPYVTEASQADIGEALGAAAAAYPIDLERVVIGGFSMGGYGALRTFVETPERYAGVAIFAGHPDLANEWLGGGFPDFLDPATLAPFEGVPVFIYHGRKDAALPFAKAEQLAAALEAAGAVVTFSPSDENGHVYQDAATQARFEAWLEQFHR